MQLSRFDSRIWIFEVGIRWESSTMRFYTRENTLKLGWSNLYAPKSWSRIFFGFLNCSGARIWSCVRTYQMSGSYLQAVDVSVGSTSREAHHCLFQRKHENRRSVLSPQADREIHCWASKAACMVEWVEVRFHLDSWLLQSAIMIHHPQDSAKNHVQYIHHPALLKSNSQTITNIQS